MNAGKLDYDDDFVYWNGKKYPRKNGKIKYKGNWVEEGHPSLPWEKKAYDAEQERVWNQLRRHTLFYLSITT